MTIVCSVLYKILQLSVINMWKQNHNKLVWTIEVSVYLSTISTQAVCAIEENVPKNALFC